MNTFEQVYSNHHHISLAGRDPKSNVQWRVGLYSVVQCIMGNGHMGPTPHGQTDTQTNTCENITSPQLCWQVGHMDLKQKVAWINS